MKTLQQLRDTAKDLGLTIPSRISKEKLQSLIDQAKPKTVSAVHRLSSMATQNRLESVTHNGSDLDAVARQKAKDLEKTREEIKNEITAIVDRRKALKDQDLGSFLSDTSDLLIRKSSNVSKPKFRKIVLVKRFSVICVVTGKTVDTVFIDKLGFRVYDENQVYGYVRYARKGKYALMAYLADKHSTEVYLKEDNLTRLRFNQYSIDKVSYCHVDRPYNGDPVVYSHFMVIKGENEVIGTYETLDLAKYACLS